ncbi:hypothetical protein [Saccharothrix variisporea]|uniref:Uncharacterized protein n=1 Tax=Saccharothrix variisporea TaxID=543527 RepID=A0A495X1F2_9PSEU|nr:hypothetical protein [Saccharothrix variisporea]RKT67095.1 hypothetical protein DFJ66_0263 [Saccharothrix variisporea]
MATVTQTLLAADGQFLSSAFPGLVKNGSNFPVVGLAFDAATDEAVFWSFYAANYGSGNVTVRVFWYADTASSGDVVWEAQLAAITANTDTQDVETKALATANTATDTHLGTTGQRLHSVDITVSNLDSLASGDSVWLRLARDANNASDTMTGDAIVEKVVLTYSDT